MLLGEDGLAVVVGRGLQGREELSCSPFPCFPLLGTARHNSNLRPDLAPATLPLGSKL